MFVFLLMPLSLMPVNLLAETRRGRRLQGRQLLARLHDLPRGGAAAGWGPAPGMLALGW